MILRLLDLAEADLEFDSTLRLTAMADAHSDLVSAPEVRFRGRVRPGPDERNPVERARLEARLEGEPELACSRCLEPFPFPVAVPVRLTLVADLPPSERQEHQVLRHETQFWVVSEDRVDLVEIAAEQVDLALPLKPVCRPDCAGLCPTCGANRNTLECGCRAEAPDPRLEALRAIQEEMKNRRG